MEDIFKALNKNGDNSINAGDNENTDMYDFLMENCNVDGDDAVDRCEIFDCLVKAENEMRDK